MQTETQPPQPQQAPDEAAPAAPGPLPLPNEDDDAAKIEKRREKDRERQRRNRAKKRQEEKKPTATRAAPKPSAPPAGPSMGARKAHESDPPPVVPTVTAGDEGKSAAALAALADPKVLAGMFVFGLDTVAVKAGKIAFGAEIGVSMAADPEAKAMIEGAAVEVIKTMDVQMSPMHMLLACVLIAYVPSALECAAMGDEVKKRAKDFERDAAASNAVKTPPPSSEVV